MSINNLKCSVEKVSSIHFPVLESWWLLETSTKMVCELLFGASFVNNKVAKDGNSRYLTEWKVFLCAFNKGGTAIKLVPFWD